MAVALRLGPQIPERIASRLKVMDEEIRDVVSDATSGFSAQIPNRVAFRFQHAALGEILTVEERAQSVSFITRFEHLPDECRGQLVKHGGGWHIENLAFLRHTLNDFRPIIQNQSDAVHYQKVHSFCYRAFRRNDPREGLTLRALGPGRSDVTPAFAEWLGERNRAIGLVLGAMEYDYLYNGVLQHSDVKFSERFLDDYVSGQINYLFWKHAHLLAFIRGMLLPYYRVLNGLTFPKLGPL